MSKATPAPATAVIDVIEEDDTFPEVRIWLYARLVGQPLLGPLFDRNSWYEFVVDPSCTYWFLLIGSVWIFFRGDYNVSPPPYLFHQCVAPVTLNTPPLAPFPF